MRSTTLIGFYTMVRKDVVRIFRIWKQTLLPPVITTGLYFAVFGAFIGRQIGDIHGFSYMQFIVPGLLMMTIITNAFMNTVSTFYFAKWTHTIDEILVSPMKDWAVIAGFISGGIIRAFLSAVLVIIVALFFTHLTIHSVLVLIVAFMLTSFLFALAGIVNAVYANSIDSISIVPTFILQPLTFLGGVFYSVDSLPHFFRSLSLVNPVLYMVNAFRYGFLGFSDVPLTTCFAVLAGFTIIMVLWALWLFRRGIGVKR